MPEFQRKPVKFISKGQNWNAPIDLIPDNQQCFNRNVRAGQQGVLTQRPGLTAFSDLGGTYVHSIARLNNFNTTLVNFSFVYVIGRDSVLYVGDTSAHLLNGAINPIKLPPSGSAAILSGNPLTMVDMAPRGTNVGWKYIGDSAINCSVGYYPGDSTAGMARGISMGMTPPVNVTIPTVVPSGLLVGDYQWIFAYRNRYTGARSNPSAATRVTLASPALTLSSEQASLTVPTTPIDPQTGSADANILIDIYRYGGTIFDWRYVGTAASGTTFVDNLSDASILTSDTPPEITDANTGLTRFPLFKPFVIQDNAKYSSTNGTITINGTTGKYTLTRGGSDVFDVDWLPGQVISINNNAWTIYQVVSTTVIEIAEDPGANLVNAGTYPWATLTGTLKAGSPLPHIWGPYGTGVSGAYIFGCGSTNSAADAGTLYWTNGNDPDSADLANSLLVTSPSEPLRGGCIYDGTPFVWSTERMFRIYPAATAGQFTVQEVPGGKGIWAEYSLTVQSNGISDQSVSWVGKDGIYDWSTSQGLQCLTDADLYPFFPHDNQPGSNLATIFPFIIEPHVVNAPDFTSANIKYHRLCWYQGELFYDFPCIVSAANVYHTLVYDSKEAHGWISLDQYSNGTAAATAAPVCRGIEIAASNMKLGIGGIVLDYTGVTDAGTAVPCRVITRADDQGDTRAQKLYGDYWLDLTPGGGSLLSTAWLDNFTVQLPTETFTTSAREQRNVTTETNGLGALGRNFCLDLTWSNTSSLAALYQYNIGYVPKPEFTSLRATDKTDDGYVGAKYLRGLCIESNTSGSSRTVVVLVDGASAGTLTVATAKQLESPYAITPIVGSEFQLQPTDGNQWELFTVRWVWEKWPDLTVIQSNWMDLGTSKPKYIRGFSLPLSGPASPTISFTATYDGSSTYATTAVAPSSISAKSPAQYSFNPPILAHYLKLTPSAACRVWYDEIKWDAEEWPELATFYGPVENLGTSQAKYLRGFELPIETGTVSVAMALTHDVQPTATTGASLTETFAGVSTALLSKNVFPFTPATPTIAHVFQLNSNGPARFWYGEVKWDFEVWPEFDTGKSKWLDDGNPSAKFMQGLVIPIDTGGNAVTFDLVYDGGTVAVGPFTTTAGKKTPVPFSYPTPFIAHAWQIAPRTACRVWEDEIKWVWEPVPELVTTYTTQATDHDLPGYHYLFDCYIAYIGSSDAPVLSITTEYSTLAYTLPVSNGVYTRAYLQLAPQKAKWRSYSITSTEGIRLFLKDCEVRVKNWTDKGQYPSSFQSAHPFGDLSRESGARI